jgi:AcrR family transcriptional regulator
MGARRMFEQKQRRRSKKRASILEAAIRLFTAHGIRRITIEEICREAGASKMTFYKYFSNKMALLKHIWNGWFEEAYRKLDEIDAMAIPFPEKMRRLIQYKMELLETMSPAFIEEVIHAEPELAAFIGEMKQRNYRLFTEFVRKAQGRGDMREMRPELFSVILDMMMDLVSNDALLASYPSRLELIHEVHNFLFFGILPARPVEAGG